ncbi:MAG: hypothetical protein UHK44_04080 [Bacteroidaceae bacterium]|nr:hypothetical protein [Bacteroidaceae bacterium]
MEITLEAIISLVGLFVGGGGGAFFTWRYMRRKARAEAVQAEVEAAKEKQEYYRAIIDDVAKDRDYYKGERDEIRERMEKLTRSFMDWRLEADNDRAQMKLEIARLGRKVEMMAPFMCGDMSCKLRKRVVLSDDGEPKNPRQKKREQHDIEPINNEDM